MYNINHFSRTVKSDFTPDDPLVLNVQFHIVRDDDGNNVYGVEEEHLLASIARLNIAFNEFNIFFKFRGNTYIDDSEYLMCYGPQYNQPTYWDLRVRSFPDNYNYDNINVFVTGIGNQATFDYSDVYLNHSTVKSQITSSPSIYLIHEFGHAFSLLHIFEGTMGTVNFVTNNIPDSCLGSEMALPNFDGYIPHPYYPSAPENVTRDPNNTDDYNADTAGDFVIDTNASFRGLNWNCCPLGGDEFEFWPHPDVIDLKGEMYIELDDERTNYMHYASQANHFSNGQGVRMRESIENDINGHLQEKLTTVESLYEPYKGIYFTCGNYPEYLANPPYLQPGFNYEYVECGDGSNEMYVEPAPYVETFSYTTTIIYSQNSTDFNRVKHPNHSAIRIIQLDNQPQKCWNNWNKGASSGSITKFNDGVINYNITIYPKDSIQINDSNLILDLNSGLYKIEKQYNDGSQEQNVIIKNNE